VFCGNEQLGEEVHTYGAFGDNTKKFVKMPLAVLGTVTVPEGETVDKLDIKILVTKKNGEEVLVEAPKQGEAPFRVTVTGNAEGKWFWANERTNINDAYYKFANWAVDMTTDTDWYNHPIDGQVIIW
jgi:hypothetical protein